MDFYRLFGLRYPAIHPLLTVILRKVVRAAVRYVPFST